MNLKASILLLGLLASANASANVLLTAGDTLRLDYDFTDSGLSGPLNWINISLNFTADIYDPGESFGFESFDSLNHLTGSSTTENLFAFPGIGAGLASAIDTADYKGSLVVTWLVGSAYITDTVLSVSTATNFAAVERVPEAPTTPVPEPAALTLIGIGLAGMGLGRRRKRT